jgi:hypothetical protein
MNYLLLGLAILPKKKNKQRKKDKRRQAPNGLFSS